MPLNSRTSPLALALLSSLLGLLAHARAPPHRMSLVDVAALRVELADASDFAISAAPSAGPPMIAMCMPLELSAMALCSSSWRTSSGTSACCAGI